MIAQSATVRRIVLVRLSPGEDVLLGLRQAVAEQGIGNAVLVSGVGSLSRYHVHVVKTTAMPPGDTFFRGEGPFDILTLTGAVLAGRVHAHITFANTEKALGGHLEEGCTILTFSLVTIAELDDAAIADWDRVG